MGAETGLFSLLFSALLFYWIFRLVAGPRAGFTRSALRVESWSGQNMAMILAVLSVAALMLDGSLIAAESLGTDITTVVIVVALAAVVAMAAAPRAALVVVGTAGVIAQVWLIGIEHGPDAGVAVIVLSILLLIGLSVARGVRGLAGR